MQGLLLGVRWLLLRLRQREKDLLLLTNRLYLHLAAVLARVLVPAAGWRPVC